MQTVNKLLIAVLVAGALVFWWKREQSTAEYDRQVGALATTLNRGLLNPDAPAAQSEAMFYRALVILDDYRSLVSRGRINVPEEDYLQDSLTMAGYSHSPEIALVSRSLRDNLTLCSQMNLLRDGEATRALLTGRNPIIPQGAHKGDTLVVARRVSWSLAPEIVNHPGNFALAPSLAGALIWPDTMSDAVVRSIEEFRGAGILDNDSATQLKKRANDVRQSMQ